VFVILQLALPSDVNTKHMRRWIVIAFDRRGSQLKIHVLTPAGK
jgi:hypothetical protein